MNFNKVSEKLFDESLKNQKKKKFSFYILIHSFEIINEIKTYLKKL